MVDDRNSTVHGVQETGSAVAASGYVARLVVEERLSVMREGCPSLSMEFVL